MKNEPTSTDSNTKEPNPLYGPETALAALVLWDAGEVIATIEMGGIGPGYEQAIQVLVFELIRDLHDKPLPVAKSDQATWGDETIHRIDRQVGGFSGAQVGAAKQLAFRAIRDGWSAMVNSAPADRRICVSRTWPNVPPPTKEQTL